MIDHRLAHHAGQTVAELMFEHDDMKTKAITAGGAHGVVERVYHAVHVLCIGTGDVRQRLVGAGMHLLFLRNEDFPESLRNDFISIKKDMTKYPAVLRMEGTLHATMRRIKRRTGQRIAEKIWKLYEDIQELRGQTMV